MEQGYTESSTGSAGAKQFVKVESSSLETLRVRPQLREERRVQGDLSSKQVQVRGSSGRLSWECHGMVIMVLVSWR